MPIDTQIPLQAKSPDMINKLSNLVNLQQAQTNLQTSQAVQPAEIARQQAVSQQAQTAAEKARFNLTSEQLQKVQDDFHSIARDPVMSAAATEKDPTKLKDYSTQMINMLQTHAQFARQAGVPDSMVEQTLGTYLAKAALHPEKMQQFVAQRQQAGVGAAIQVEQTQVPVSSQEQMFGTSVSGQPIKTMTTQFGQKRLGVTPTQQQGIQMAPALGQEAGVAGVIAPVVKDWSDTQSAATTANKNIGFMQNIKQYAQKAITGVGQDRRSYIAGLAGVFGFSDEQIAKTDTDLLAKQVAMMAQSGKTDAERSLAESANPNTHMTPQAIKHAADQVISQQEMALKKQEFLKEHAIKIGDPADRGRSYTQALSQWNQVADPRILQLKYMTPQEKAQMKASMSPQERTDFGLKLHKAEKMGILQ